MFISIVTYAQFFGPMVHMAFTSIITLLILLKKNVTIRLKTLTFGVCNRICLYVTFFKDMGIIELQK